jgi:hypothetical protein
MQANKISCQSFAISVWDTQNPYLETGRLWDFEEVPVNSTFPKVISGKKPSFENVL